VPYSTILLTCGFSSKSILIVTAIRETIGVSVGSSAGSGPSFSIDGVGRMVGVKVLTRIGIGDLFVGSGKATGGTVGLRVGWGVGGAVGRGVGGAVGWGLGAPGHCQ
jgi:hypothetical protein